MKKAEKRIFSAILAIAVMLSCIIVPQAERIKPIMSITFDEQASPPYTPRDGAQTADGHSGAALYLNGSGAYATANDISAIHALRGDFTFSIWCNPSNTATWARLFDFGIGTEQYMFLTFSNNRPRFAITRGGNAAGEEQILDGTLDIALNEWSNIIVTRSGSTTTMYINGLEAGSTNDITLSPADLGATTTNYFGKSQYPDPYFSGMLDDFEVYSAGVTAEQAREIAGDAYEREIERARQEQLAQLSTYDRYLIQTHFYDANNEKLFQYQDKQTITAKVDIQNYTFTDNTLSAVLYGCVGSREEEIAKTEAQTIAPMESGCLTITTPLQKSYDTLHVKITDEQTHEELDGGYLCKSNAIFPPASPEDTDETTFGAHDPTIFKDPVGGHYWVYSSHNLVYESEDLIHWTEHDYTKTIMVPQKCEEFIYHNYTDLGIDKNNADSNKHVNATYWAPDLIYKANDEYPYWFYLSVSCGLGGRNSVIGLVKAKSPGLWDGEYQDYGVVLATKEMKGYKTNAIDANLYTDTDGKTYFIWGSFWQGIQAAPLKEDGTIEGVDYTSDDTILSSCMNFGTTVFASKSGTYGPEGAYMVTNKATGYRYMFASYGWLGTNYNIRVVRSPLSKSFGSSMTELKDADGNSVATAHKDAPIDSFWGYKASGSYRLGDGIEYCGSGHNSVFQDDDGSWYLIEHCRKVADAAAYLQVRKILWTADGWPVVSPVVYAGEREQKLPKAMLYGTWDLSSVGHTIFKKGVTTVTTGSKDADLPVHSSEIILLPDGTIGGERGRWQFDGDHTVTLTFTKDGNQNKNEYYKNGDTMTLFVMTGYDKDKRESCVTMTGVNQNHIAQFAKKSNACLADTVPPALKTTAKELPKSTGGNPILGFDQNGDILYGGDPAALVVGDTVYLYVGHDVSTDAESSKSIYNMPEWVCYSSKNMTDWTYEGVVMKATDIPWRNDDTSAWASQMVEHNGKYYLYYCTWAKTDDGKQSIGVAVSDSPTGPFRDIGRPLVNGSATEPQSSNWNDIDPTVLVETVDGVERRYLAWGNGKYYVCELNEDMISVTDQNNDGIIDGNDIREPKFLNMQTTYTEAPWLYKRDGKYYLFFAAGWRERMAYATADSPYGPYSFGGIIMPPTATSNTNHPSVIDFGGKTYFIYHNGSLPRGCGFRRSVCIAQLRFEEDGRVCPVAETSTGLGGKANVLKTVDGSYIGHEPFENPADDRSYPQSKPLIAVGKENGLSTAWEFVSPLNGAAGSEYVSIQSVDKPGLYLAVVNGRIALTQNADGTMGDAMTFRSVEGLNQSADGISFESILENGKYLTVRDGAVMLSYGKEPEACTFFTADITPTPVPTAAPTPANKPSAVSFSDIASHWAKPQIEEIAAAGIINGMDDGSFQPDTPITRGQLTKLIAVMLGLDTSAPYNGTIIDTAGHWACAYIQAADTAGLIDPAFLSENQFHPDQNITREEIASLISRAISYQGNEAAADSSALSVFPDAWAVGDWAVHDMENAVTLGIIKGFDDGTLSPKAEATRAQAAVMMNRLFAFIKK